MAKKINYRIDYIRGDGSKGCLWASKTELTNTINYILNKGCEIVNVRFN